MLDTALVEGSPSITHGLHPQFDEKTYHSLPLFSNSLAQQVRRSPAHAKVWLDGHREYTDAMRTGSLIHANILEPDRFEAHHIVEGKRDKRLKAWKEAAKEHGEDACLFQSEYDKIHRIGDAVRNHPAAAQLLADSDPSLREITGFWQSDDGVENKARIDLLCPFQDGVAIVDIKTTKDASFAAFQRSIANYGYHTQGAQYSECIRKCADLNPQWFIIIAVEKEPPYAVAVYVLGDAPLHAGATQLEEYRKKWAYCLANDTYPAYSNDPQLIDLPEWEYKKIESGFIGG